MKKRNPLHYDLSSLPENLFDSRPLRIYRKDKQNLKTFVRDGRKITGGTRARKYTIKRWIPGVNVYVVPYSDHRTYDIPPNSVTLYLNIQKGLDGEYFTQQEQFTPFMMLHDWAEELLDPMSEFGSREFGKVLNESSFFIQVPMRVKYARISARGKVLKPKKDSYIEATIPAVLPNMRYLFPTTDFRTNKTHHKRLTILFEYLFPRWFDKLNSPTRLNEPLTPPYDAFSNPLSDLFALWAINRNLSANQVVFTTDLIGGWFDNLFFMDGQIKHPLNAILGDTTESLFIQRIIPSWQNARWVVDDRVVNRPSKQEMLDRYNELFELMLQKSIGRTIYLQL